MTITRIDNDHSLVSIKVNGTVQSAIGKNDEVIKIGLELLGLA